MICVCFRGLLPDNRCETSGNTVHNTHDPPMYRYVYGPLSTGTGKDTMRCLQARLFHKLRRGEPLVENDSLGRSPSSGFRRETPEFCLRRRSFFDVERFFFKTGTSRWWSGHRPPKSQPEATKRPRLCCPGTAGLVLVNHHKVQSVSQMFIMQYIQFPRPFAGCVTF